MKAVNWEDIPDEEVRPGVRRGGFGTPEVMLVMNEGRPELGRPSPRTRVLAPARPPASLRTGPVADEVVRALAAELDELGQPLAVRSSAADEDIAGRSAAGQYESVMGVVGEAALRSAIERCFSAASGERVLAYHGGTPAGMALVVQREI